MHAYNFNHIMFDMDGVIVDTSRIHKMAFEQAFLGYEVNFTYEDWKGSSTKDVVAAVFKDLQLPIGELAYITKAKQKIALSNLKSTLPEDLFFEGAIDSLVQLAEKFKIALCTAAGEETVQHVLAVKDLAKLFTFVITSNEISRSKPDPEIYNAGARKFKKPPYECLVIEDSKNGLLAAYRAGCQIIHYGTRSDESVSVLPFFSQIASVENHKTLKKLLLE